MGLMEIARLSPSPATGGLYLFLKQILYRYREYGWVALAIGGISVLNYGAHPWVNYWSAGFLYLFCLLILSFLLARGPVLLAATLSAVLWHFVFIPPHFSFHITNLQDGLMLMMYFTVALTTGTLTTRIREQEQVVTLREARTNFLYQFTRKIAGAIGIEEIIRTVVEEISGTFEARVAILLRDPAKTETLYLHPLSGLALNPEELKVAQWAFFFAQPAGYMTDNFSQAAYYNLPLHAQEGVVGVMAVNFLHRAEIESEQRILLETFASQIGLVLERQMLLEAAEQARMIQKSEHLYKTLLNSISHELRTPITTIKGAISGLMEPEIRDNPEINHTLLNDIQEAAERLNRVVANLLDMTRLEVGYLKLNLDWCDLSDLINVTLHSLEKELSDFPVSVHLPDYLPLVRLDFVLFEQVLTNLLLNVTVHTPPNTHIWLQAEVNKGKLYLHIEDDGPGFPPQGLKHLFDKFYRGPHAATGGTGLGLSICKGLVEAHEGQIVAENRKAGGACVQIILNALKMPDIPEEPWDDE